MVCNLGLYRVFTSQDWDSGLVFFQEVGLGGLAREPSPMVVFPREMYFELEPLNQLSKLKGSDGAFLL